MEELDSQGELIAVAVGFARNRLAADALLGFGARCGSYILCGPPVFPLFRI